MSARILYFGRVSTAAAAVQDYPAIRRQMALCPALLIHDQLHCIILMHAAASKSCSPRTNTLPACVLPAAKGAFARDWGCLAPYDSVRAQPGKSSHGTLHCLSGQPSLWLSNVSPVFRVSRSRLLSLLGCKTRPFTVRRGWQMKPSATLDAFAVLSLDSFHSTTSSALVISPRYCHGITTALLALTNQTVRRGRRVGGFVQKFGRTVESDGLASTHDAAYSVPNVSGGRSGV